MPAMAPIVLWLSAQTPSVAKAASSVLSRCHGRTLASGNPVGVFPQISTSSGLSASRRMPRPLPMA
jgi:hypothetical protein